MHYIARPLLCLLALLLLSHSAALGYARAAPAPTAAAHAVYLPIIASPAALPGYALVWSDEFEVDGLPDPSRWSYDTEANATGWYNNELQYYAVGRLSSSRVSGGRLTITARKERLDDAPDYGGQRYSSARLITNHKASWTYGFIDVRAKLPCGRGTWPAIWMLGTSDGPWPDKGEIDIMEQVGALPTTINGGVHTAAAEPGAARGGTTQVADACEAFHSYQLAWTPETMTFGVDNRPYFTYRNPHTGAAAWPFTQPQYLILNLAVGGDMGGQVDDDILPAHMEVEYVRVYQRR